MSTIPYIAPWQTAFERFATSLIHPGTIGPASVAVDVAPGQWWRIIYWTVELVTSAGAGNRLGSFVTTAGGLVTQNIRMPAVQVASTTVVYLFAPGQQPLADTTIANQGYMQNAIPDVLIGPGTNLTAQLASNQVGDTVGSVNTLAVEIYAESRPGVFTPVETPVLA